MCGVCGVCGVELCGVCVWCGAMWSICGMCAMEEYVGYVCANVLFNRSIFLFLCQYHTVLMTVAL